MDDLISRQAAIDILFKEYNEKFFGNSEQYIFGIINAMGFINGLPAAQPEPQWIPCSDRLPERCQYYIVTDFGTVNEAYYDSTGRWFTESGNKLKDVIAWMPLPESYKGE